MLRLFVALEIPAEIQSVLADVILQFRTRFSLGIRWTRPENLHLTLKFLGPVPEDQLSQIQEALSRALTGERRVSLTLTKLGTFGPPKKPRVLWIGLEGEVDRLKQLAYTVEQALNPLGYPREDRPYSPHLTLARLKPEFPRSQMERFTQSVEAWEERRPGVFKASNVVLFSSRQDPDGSKYTALQTWTLTP